MKEVLDVVPKFIAAVTVLVLAVTVVHEYGYFEVIGAPLQTIATTYDYLANAFIWLPTAIGAVLSLQSIDVAVPIEKVWTEDGELTFEIRRTRLFYFFWIVGGLGFLAYLLFGGATAALSVVSLFGLTAIYVLTRNLKGDRQKLSNYRLIAFGIYLLLLSYGYGVKTAYADLSKSEDVYAVEQKDSHLGVRQLVLLRVFDKGLLVRDLPAQRVEFLRWDNVTRMSRLLPKPTVAKGYLCIWFDVACGRQASEPDIMP